MDFSLEIHGLFRGPEAGNVLCVVDVVSRNSFFGSGVGRNGKGRVLSSVNVYSSLLKMAQSKSLVYPVKRR